MPKTGVKLGRFFGKGRTKAFFEKRYGLVLKKYLEVRTQKAKSFQHKATVMGFIPTCNYKSE